MNTLNYKRNNNIYYTYYYIKNVARVRRRGDHPPHSMDVCIWKIWGDKGILVLVEK
jgi:hypothetical protein